MKRYFPGTTLRQYWWEAAYMRVRRTLARWLYRPKEYKPESWSYRFTYSVSGSPKVFRRVPPGEEL